MSTITNVSLSRITPNPFQPASRMAQVEARAPAMAALIRDHGLKNPPRGRIVDGSTIPTVDEIAAYGGAQWYLEDNPTAIVQIESGHHRWGGYKFLSAEMPEQFGTMPMLLHPATDEQMALGIYIENQGRHEQTAIEDIEYFTMLQNKFGWNQTMVASKLGVDRSTVSNKLRLRKLPQHLRQALHDGDLSERVATALLPLYQLPETAHKAAQVKKHPVHGWLRTTIADVERAALSKEETPDQIRCLVTTVLNGCTVQIDDERTLFAIDQPYENPELRSPICKKCDHYISGRKRCGDLACFKLKQDAFCQQTTKTVAASLGLPYLDPDDNSAKLSFLLTPDQVSAIKRSGCENLAVQWFRSGSSAVVSENSPIQYVCKRAKCLCAERCTKTSGTSHSEQLHKQRVKWYKSTVVNPALALIADGLKRQNIPLIRYLLCRVHHAYLDESKEAASQIAKKFVNNFAGRMAAEPKSVVESFRFLHASALTLGVDLPAPSWSTYPGDTLPDRMVAFIKTDPVLVVDLVVLKRISAASSITTNTLKQTLKDDNLIGHICLSLAGFVTQDPTNETVYLVDRDRIYTYMRRMGVV